MANDNDNQNIDPYGADSIWAADPSKSPHVLARYVLDTADYYKHMCREIQSSDAAKLKIAEEMESVVDDLDTLDYSVLTTLAATYIREGESMPRWLNKFAADALTGQIKPRARKGRKQNTRERDFALWAATTIVSDIFKMPKYANGNETRKTAAHVVNEVTSVSYDVIVQAVRKHAHFVPPNSEGKKYPLISPL